jgi:predicted dehydrogenase
MSKHNEQISSPGRRSFLTSAGVAAVTPGLAASQSESARQPQAKKRIGVGLIGCGARGNYLARVTQQLKELGESVEVVAVADIYQPRLERTATRFSAKYYQNSRDLVRDADVDAVIVATPDRLHAYHVLEAIRAGKDVYSEKPPAHWQQFDLFKELVREARRSGKVYQMGTQRLADRVWRQAAEAIARGDIGKAVHVQMGYFRRGDSGERGMRIDDPNARPGVGLDWEAFLADAPKRPFTVSRFFQWRMYMDYSGGPMTDNNVHFLSLMIKALGVKVPTRVVALGGKFVFNGDRDVPDTFDMVAEYPEGLNLTFMGTYANETPVDTVVRGTKGTFTLRGEPDSTIEPLPGLSGPRREFGHGFDIGVEHVRDFFNAVRTREQPQGDIELAYRTQVLLVMAMRSFMDRKVATFDPEKEEIRTA